MADKDSKEEEKEIKLEIDYESFKYELPPKLTDEELTKFNKEVVEVYKYKCKYEFNESKDAISFYPSPHVKEQEYGKTIFENKSLSQTWMIKQNISKLEGMNNWKEEVITDGSHKICSFISCCYKAWAHHYPLKLSPSHILLLVLQGIAIHVDKNAEKLRNKYVKHDDKMKLEIVRDDEADNFIFARPDKENNDWSSVIAEFCDKIDKNTVDDTVKLMESDFNCSSIVDKISAKVTIMDICKNYFEYVARFICMCGFPKITLNGTKNDWIKLRVKCERLLKEKVSKQFGAKWSATLLPILDRFIAVYDGDIDCIFWNSMVRISDTQYIGSGGEIADPLYCGWMNVFFPFYQGYKGEFKDNPHCFREYKMDFKSQSSLKSITSNKGIKCTEYPSGLSSAPVTCIDEVVSPTETHKVKFYSGFCGYKQDSKTLELEPVVSWFIGHPKNK